MSAAVAITLILVHIAFWLIQVSKNSLLEGQDCVDIAKAACGGPLEHLVNIVSTTNRPDDFGSTIGFLTGAVGSFFGFLFDFAFLNYDWMNGGGQIVDLVVIVIRVMFGAIFLTVIAKMASAVLGGKLF